MTQDAKKYDAVCFPGTTYALLLYLLIEPYNVERTFFFVDYRIPQYISNLISHYRISEYDTYNSKNKIKLFFDIRRKFREYDKVWRINKLKGLPIYGMDHVASGIYTSFSRYLLYREEKFILLEDGIGNYVASQKQNLNRKSFRNLGDAILKLKYFPLWGTSDRITEIFLTGISTIPDIIKDKVKLFDLSELWEKSNNKELIIKIFNIGDIVEAKRKKILLLTQPLYENIEDHITLYKKLTKNISEKDLIIKPHPATSEIDYKSYFPQAVTLNSIAYTPIELLFLVGLKIEKVITVSSSASSFLKRYAIVETHDELFEQIKNK